MDTVQENKYYNTDFTNQRWRNKGEGEDGKEEKERKQHGESYLPEKHSCSQSVCVCVCVFSKNVAGGHFSISNPISLRDPVSVAADCWSPLEPCDNNLVTVKMMLQVK